MAKQPQIAFAGLPSVNLLPRAEMDRRERSSLTRMWALAAVGAVVVAALIIAAAGALWITSGTRVAAEHARTARLASELAGFADVSAALADLSTLESFRAGAMANDLAWAPLVAGVVAALPEGVQLTEAALVPGAPPVGDEPTLQVGVSGSLTFTGGTAADQAATVHALRQVPGVRFVDADRLSSAGEGTYRFLALIEFDQSVYSGDFAEGGE